MSAVLCARGGYGVQRMVDLLDWDAIRAAGPKMFVGFSDITALHEAFATRAGLVTLHGPMAAGIDFLKNTRAQEQLRATLFAPETVRTIRAADGSTALIPGRARGVTPRRLPLPARRRARHPARPPVRPRRPAAVWRTWARRPTAWTAPHPAAARRLARRRRRYRPRLLGASATRTSRCGRVLVDRLGGLGVPVVEEFGFGHGDGALTIPFGVTAELDAEAGTLTLDEPALT